MSPETDLGISEDDIARMSGKPLPLEKKLSGVEIFVNKPFDPDFFGPIEHPDPATEIENKVAPRVAEAALIKVVDQATLNAVGDRLAVNKALQKEAIAVFKPIKQKMDAAKQEVLDQEKRVMGPLQQEERLLKLASDTFLAEQERIERARQEQLRIAREAEERRLLAQAEMEAKQREAEADAILQAEHEQEIERALESLPADTPREVIEAICNAPAPEPVHIAIDVPILPPIPKEAPAILLPKGMSRRKTYRAEVVNLTLLCRAIAEGKAPTSYVTANMTALNARARADELSMAVPGVKAVEDTGIGQRTR